MVRNDEARNLARVRVGRYERNRSPMMHIVPQFPLRISDSRRKALLIHTPEHVEIFWLEFADDEGHGAIVAGQAG